MARMVMNRKPIVAVGSINIDPVARAERIPLAGETVHSSDLQIHPGGEGRESGRRTYYGRNRGEIQLLVLLSLVNSVRREKVLVHSG